MNQLVRSRVLHALAPGQNAESIGRAKFKIGSKTVHTRFKAKSPFSFGVNPNTLSADYEVWICGNPDLYYLIPLAVIQGIYSDPQAYVDNTHPDIRVVSVDSFRHSATYAAGGKALDLTPFLRSTLPAAT